MSKMKLSLVVPCYNEEENIRDFYNAARQVLEAEDYEYELVFVNDGSRDRTQEELENIREKLATPDLVLQSSIGLYNINQRIRLCYGQEYGMEIESRYGEGTQVILYLPAIAESTDF